MLVERELELTRLTTTTMDELKGLTDQVEPLKVSVAQLKQEVSSNQALVAPLQTTHKSLLVDNKQLQTRNKELKELNEAATREYDLAIRKIADKMREIETLEFDKQGLIQEIHELEDKINGIIYDNDQLISQCDEKIEKKERELALLDHKTKSLQENAINIQRSNERERRELADRKMALDKQDENLRIRARKVKADEELVSRNASLLEL